MVRIEFEGVVYASNFINQDSRSNTFKATALPIVVPNGYEIIETEHEICFSERRIQFNLENSIAFFKNVESESIWSYNKDTNEWNNPVENEVFSLEDGLINTKYQRSWNGTHNMDAYFLELFFKVINHLNPYLGTKLLASTSRFNNYLNSKTVNNFYKLTNQEMVLAADKIFSAMGPDYFYSQMSGEYGLVINSNGKKARQLIGLPERVMSYLKINSVAGLDVAFRTICEEDANEGIVLLDYFQKVDNLKTFKKSEDKTAEAQFIRNLAQAKEIRPEIKPSRLLRYLIKQRFAYSFMQYAPLSWGSQTNMREVFLIPNSELKTYVDYLNMSSKNSELYPRNLVAAHNVCVRNAQILNSQNLAKQYEEAVKTLEPYCYEKKDYLITYPKTINELVMEGNELEHCVATYASTIAKGSTKVFCLRKADEPTVPFVTIEVDNDNNIVQVKEKYDLDVTDPEVLEFLKKWRKEKLA